MKIKSQLVTVLFLLLVFSTNSFTQVGKREMLDKIAVVVGEEVILMSEIASQIQMFILQSGKRPSSEEELGIIEEEIIDQMISDRLFLIAAKKDTSFSIRESEIEAALEDQIAQMSQNFPNDDAFLNALAEEGLTLRELKKKYRKDAENQLLKQRYIQSKIYNVSVSKFEVEEFYNNFKDSIPIQPEAVRLAHILLKYETSQKIEDSVRAKATALRQKILEGADFAVISSEYSSPPSGDNGGDLGYVSKEDVVPEFSRAAFNLKIGDISGVIRTQFGYHVIKCEGKKDNKLKLRHILLSVVPSKEDSLATLKKIDSLTNELNNGSDFAELAKDNSLDDNSRARGGEIGWITTTNIPSDIAPEIAGWITPGEIKSPVSTSEGVHILKLLEYSAEKQYSLESDFDQIKEMARQNKTSTMVEKWVKELKEKTYISYKADMNAAR